MKSEYRPSKPTPTEADATRILSEVTGQPVAWLARFPTGLMHYVYDARLADGRQLVVRLTRPESKAEFAGAVYWHRKLRPIGAPLPKLHHADPGGTEHGLPVLIMERLPGTDLGEVYHRLSDDEKRALARQIVGLQQRVAQLPRGSGFGYAYCYTDDSLKSSWRAVIDASLERSRGRIRDAGIVDTETIERVQSLADSSARYLDAIEPTCFLHDTTTKNVIVFEGRLSGVVDVDSVCFGDPLFTLALTRMALLSAGHDSVYVDAWAAALALPPARLRLLTLYTAVFCVDFLAELGHDFNRDVAIPAETERVRHLLAILDQLLWEAAQNAG